MAGTPTGNPEQDSPAGQRQDENGLAWERPVPTRWFPPSEGTATGLTPDPEAILKPYVTPAAPIPLTPPVNPAVMRTAPGESPA
jgi:hypothetical protein